MKVYEDKLRVRWQPASLERWLTHNQHKETFIHSFCILIDIELAKFSLEDS